MLRKYRPEWDEIEHHDKMLEILPENDALAALPTELWEGLTPLEKVVIWWNFTRGGLTIVRIQALPIIGLIPHELLLDVWQRTPVRNCCKKVKALTPYLSLYTNDYFVELIHEEVELLRARSRIVRNGQALTPADMNSIEWRKNEREDVNTLLRCLEMVQKVVEVKKDDGEPISDLPSRVAGVLAEAEAFIAGTEEKRSRDAEELPGENA